jgi:hypothetical protein
MNMSFSLGPEVAILTKAQIDAKTSRSLPVIALIGSALFVGAAGDRPGLAEALTYSEPVTHWPFEAAYAAVHEQSMKRVRARPGQFC